MQCGLRGHCSSVGYLESGYSQRQCGGQNNRCLSLLRQLHRWQNSLLVSVNELGHKFSSPNMQL